MKRKRKLLGVTLVLSALLILQLPPSGADAASVPEFAVSASGTLLSYNGKSTDVVIPSSVVEIATDAFKDNDNIRSVTIPNSVRKINEYAFWDCDNLQSVSIGSGLTRIDDFVFANCMGLVSVSLPKTIEKIGIYAFEDDVNLEAITITQDTHYIHDSAFDGCYKLVIFAPEGSYAWNYAQEFYIRQKQFPVYEDTGFVDPVIIKEGETDDGEGTTVVDETDTDTEPGAFTTRYEVTARPDGTYTAVAIGQNPNIYGESRVVAGNAVVFMDNSSMHVYNGSEPQEDPAEIPDITAPEDRVYFSSTIPKYTIVDGTIVADKAFYMSDSLEDMSLPEGVREIGEFAFSRTEASAVSLPEGIEYIDYGAFYHCDRLDHVQLPLSVKKIEPYAFAGTPWVDDFLSGTPGYMNFLDGNYNASDGDFLVSGGALIAYRGRGGNVNIPSGVRIIAAGCFKDNKDIRSVTLPNTLLSIGEEAFSGCTALSDVAFGGNEEEILDRAFSGTLISVRDLPDRIVNVGTGAFDDMSSSAGLNVTYETSSCRLSNMAYRSSVQDRKNAGVTVSGYEGAIAYLDGADRPYTLTISENHGSELIDKAVNRAASFLSDRSFEEGLLFDMVLTDSSGIPITKLGNQGLEVAFPLPEGFDGYELSLYTCDRNGQLEDLPVEIVDSPAGKYVRFVTFHLSPFALYKDGASDGSQLITSDVVLRAASGGQIQGSYQGNSVRRWLVSRGVLRLIVCGLLVVTGIFFISIRKKKS